MNREKRKKDNPDLPTDYAGLLALVKERVRSAQYAALKVVNTELVGLYWDIGRMIVERQDAEGWGKAVVENLAADLRAEFPGVGGFSASNLWRMKGFLKPIKGLKNSHRWCEKSVGAITSSSRNNAHIIQLKPKEGSIRDDERLGTADLSG